MRKLETMFLKNLFDIQDKKKQAKFLLAKDGDTPFLIYDKAYVFRIFGAWFFDEDVVLNVLNQSKPFTGILRMLDDFDGNEIVYDGTTIFAGHEVAYFKTTGDNVYLYHES